MSSSQGKRGFSWGQMQARIEPVNGSECKLPPEYDEVAEDGLANEPKLSEKAADLADMFAGVIHTRSQVKLWTTCVRAKRKIGIKKDGSGTIDVSADRYVPVTGYVKLNEMGICELGSDLEDEVLPLDSQSQDERDRARKHNTRVTQSQALLHYFAKLARSDDVEEEIDIEFVDNLIQGGADVNTRDVFGQSLLHEVARAWHTSVAVYLIEMGADINGRDYLGRTPLHVAAAVDYCDMIDLLLDYGAVLECLTYEENQTPLHFAARNDASNALVRLIKCRADIEARDYKNRTPLHVSAELDRSDTARLLLEYGANAGVVDSSGMSAIVLMVRKMSHVAKEALDQFHKKDRANRKQLFYLDKLEHVKAEADGVAAHSVLQVVVHHNKLDLITHPIFEKLIEVKWDHFGWRGAMWQLSVNLLFVLSWTAQALSEPSGDPAEYNLPDDIFRIALYVMSVMLWLYMFILELFELYDSKKAFKTVSVSLWMYMLLWEIHEIRTSRSKHLKWYNWRKRELEKDFKYLHQRWPEEENYLRFELQGLEAQEPSYFRDFWNIFDWITYAILLFQLILHVVDVLAHHEVLTNVQRGLFAIAIILVWIRLMKSFRAFRAVGPFIVICTYMIKDIFRWLFLYVLFYIPYCVAFFMIFGGDDIKGYQTFPDVMYTMFRITLVDDYNFEGLEEKQQTMARILCGSFLGISAIVMLNLFIALLSDTFQRVYDNAQANAFLQQASFIQSEEEALSYKKLNQFRDFIHNKCSPLKEYYDDEWEEAEDDLKKVTVQIKEILEDYLDSQGDLKREREMAVADEKLQPDLELLYSMVRNAMHDTERKANREIRTLKREVIELKSLLLTLVGNTGTRNKRNSRERNSRRPSPGTGGDEGGSSDDGDSGGDEAPATIPATPPPRAQKTKELKKKVSGTLRKDSQLSVTPRDSLYLPKQEERIAAEDEADVVNQPKKPKPQRPVNEEQNLEANDVPANMIPAVPNRPRRLRQIQVMPEDDEEDMLARYGHVDFSDNMFNRVNVRTRPVVMPPAYSSKNGNPTA